MKRKFLMCKPTYFDVKYAINPWMNTDVPVDKTKAMAEWAALHQTLIKLGAEISLIEPVKGLPDMVFSAEGGLVKGRKVIMSNMKMKERREETKYYEKWFLENDYQTFYLPDSLFFESGGDSAWLKDKLILAYGIRSDKEVAIHLERFLDIEVLVSLKLIDERYYHLGACLSVLSDDLLMYYPAAFDNNSLKAIQGLTKETIEVKEKDAFSFVCNNARVDKNLIMAGCSEELEKMLNHYGFKIIRLNFIELKKSGGTAGCSVLSLI